MFNTSTHNTLSTAHLAYPPSQIPITCRHYVALVLLHTLHNAIIRIRALVRAGDALHTGVLCVWGAMSGCMGGCRGVIA